MSPHTSGGQDRVTGGCLFSPFQKAPLRAKNASPSGW